MNILDKVDYIEPRKTNLQNNEIYYCEPVYRPPSEAYSLLIQATEGCTYRCTFCISNTGKKFKVRSTEDISIIINC